MKQLCGAYKAEVKLDEKAAAAREEKKKDLEVVRSARCTFDEQKDLAKKSSSSLHMPCYEMNHLSELRFQHIWKCDKSWRL